MATTTSPATTGLKYTYRDGEGYREWYRANTGQDWDGNYLTAKPEGMSDVDWTQGMMLQKFEGNKSAADEQKQQSQQQLTDIYNQQTSAAQQSYQSAANQYGQQMKNELEYAGVLHERMKKYLPQQMKAQGMGNMGVAQTASANAVAKHVSSRAAITGQYQSSMNELNRTHGERQAALDADYKSGMMAADQAYNDRMTQLNDQHFNDEMALFGQTVDDKNAEQKSYFESAGAEIRAARTPEEALEIVEAVKPYVSEAQYNQLVMQANGRGNELEGIEEDELKEENKESQDKAAGQLRDLLSVGTDSAELRETLESMIAEGTIPESDRAYWEGMISAQEAIEQEKADGKIKTDQEQAAANAKELILGAVDAAARAEQLAACAAMLERGEITQSQYDFLKNLVSVLDGNQQEADEKAAQDKAADQLRDLLAVGTNSAEIREKMESMIAAGTIPESDRAYWEGLISAREVVEQKAASDEKEADQLQEMTNAENLILNAVDAAARAEQLAACRGKVSDAQYSYLERLVSVLDGNQAKEETQAGYDAANADLTTLYHAGASSVDLQTTFDSLKAAGKIEPGREQFWTSMISLRKQAEDEIAAGKIKEDQASDADFAMVLLGEAMASEDRADILAGCATWLETGRITQTQYDMIVAYAKVLDGNAEYLKQQEKDAEDEQDHEIFYENTLTYIAFAAADYDDAVRYAESRRDEFSDAEWDSIQTQLAARKLTDEENAKIKQDAAQAEAEERFIDQMSLYASSSDATAKISALLESYKDKLHPDVYEAWKMYIDDLKDSPMQKYNENLAGQDEKLAERENAAIAKGYASAAEYDAAVLAGRESLSYNSVEVVITGGQYDVENSGYKDFIKNQLESLGYNGIFDKNIDNGTTVRFEGLKGTKVTITYYNGAWYPSKMKSGGRGGTF